jgi:carbamoyltransferase
VSKTILGISAFYHDSAAAIVRDGEIVAAAQEERFSRKKHDPRFPHHAINYCLEEAFIQPDELDAIVFYDNPVLTLDRVIKNCLTAGSSSLGQFETAARSVLGVKVWIEDFVRRSVGSLGREGRLLFTEHHMSHAASAFYPSPFRDAAIIVADGVGEWATTTLGQGHNTEVELFQEIDYPHSLGLLYSAFTAFCGFKVNSGEYKLMGLAPYGKPVYADLIRKYLIDVRSDGSYRLDLSYFGYLEGHHMTNERFHDLFGGPPRAQESTITRREMDLAASVQVVLEEVMLTIARHVRARTGLPRLVLAGGVALNCVMNGKLLREKIFDELWIQPAAGDAGGSLGAALMAHYHYFGGSRPYNPSGREQQRGSLWGPAFSVHETKALLDRKGYPYTHIPDANERAQAIAKAMADGKIVGFCAGRMEFGPRSLGARSIIGDARRTDMQQVMNLKIKYRESFRPFAPAVLFEDAAEYFDIHCESPYMLLVEQVQPARQRTMNLEGFEAGDDDMMKVINQPRSDIPAVTHVDYSARVQTVHPDDNPEFARVLKAFKELTGYAVVVNTSFNVRGEPIVCTPQDAYRCFMRTDIDLLVLDEMLLWKADQPPMDDNQDWKKEYELD